VQFEPEYLERFHAYAELKALLTYSLCAVDMRSRGIKESSIHQRAITLLRSTLKQLSQSEQIEGRSVTLLERMFSDTSKEPDSPPVDLKDVLQQVLSLIESKVDFSPEKYEEPARHLMSRLEALSSRYSELEARALERFRPPKTPYPQVP